ncbi:MAG: hypothetical protein BWK79_09820, partial [Beggiatoa sp. IS2]
MRPLYWLIWVSLFLTACVTINVYFPAAAAERAADQIIDQVWGKESQPSSPGAEPAKKEPADSRSSNGFFQFSWLINTALAEANIDISSPAIQTIKDRMAERHSQLLSYYNNGAIGLTYDG